MAESVELVCSVVPSAELVSVASVESVLFEIDVDVELSPICSDSVELPFIVVVVSCESSFVSFVEF